METNKKIVDELNSINQPLGTLSTISGDRSQSASVYYVHDDKCNLYFITRSASRKYKNLETNKNVSFVITSENPPHTIQIEGTAERVTDAHEESEYFTKLVSLASSRASIPPVAQMPTSETVFMKITPNWIRFGNFDSSITATEAVREGENFVEFKK